MVVDSETMISNTVSKIVESGDDLVVISDGKDILGTVDLVTILKFADSLGSHSDNVPIIEIADHDAVFARPNTSLDDVLAIMMEHKQSTIPVVDSELVGSINIYDILKRKNGKTGVLVSPEILSTT
ncbi:CBS domain-containing protein [archaeon]|nr:CBS domain-containing protein [archaeon]